MRRLIFRVERFGGSGTFAPGIQPGTENMKGDGSMADVSGKNWEAVIAAVKARKGGKGKGK